MQGTPEHAQRRVLVFPEIYKKKKLTKDFDLRESCGYLFARVDPRSRNTDSNR